VVYGALLLLAYGVGHCAVIVAAGTSAELVQTLLNWNEQSKRVDDTQDCVWCAGDAGRRVAGVHRAMSRTGVKARLPVKKLLFAAGG